MAVNTYDFRLIGTVDGSAPMSTTGTSVQDSAVASGAAGTISIGDIVVKANGYWAKVANGGGATIGLYGIAASNSTDTVAADGLVKVKYHPSGLIVRGAPKTAGNLAQGILDDLVTLDVDTGVITVDEDDPNGVCRIKGYDSDNGTIDIAIPYGAAV